MDDIPLSALFGALLISILVSAFFSAAEIAMMSLNRYRLRHLAKSKHRAAVLTRSLLTRPDRVIGITLLGSNFSNAFSSAITTVIAIRLLGEQQSTIAIATIVIGLVILIFTDLTPKTMAALHPERVAFPSSFLLAVVLKIFYPLVWLINGISNTLLKMFGVHAEKGPIHEISRDELRMVVNEAGALIPQRHQRMLLSILDLEQVTVDDIMIPRNEIVGINLDDDMEEIMNVISSSPYTRLPLYHEHIDQVTGIIHLRNAVHLIAQGKLDKDALIRISREAYFVPEGTPLHTQLANFQRHERRIGLVVDEYGDIQGLVTLEDILEEIVGEFTIESALAVRDVYRQEDGSFLVDCSANVRTLNRMMHWELPTDGPKTLNGLILEYLETIPEPGTSLLIAGYPIEILQTTANAVKTIRIQPELRRVKTIEEPL